MAAHYVYEDRVLLHLQQFSSKRGSSMNWLSESGICGSSCLRCLALLCSTPALLLQKGHEVRL